MDAGSQERLQDPPNSDIPGESEPGFLGKHETSSSNTQTDDSNEYPLFSSQHDKRRQCAGKEQTGQNMASKCEMDQQEMGTEINYTYPQGVSEFDQATVSEFDQATDSGNTVNGNHFQNPKSSKIQRETESRFLRVSVPFLTHADITRIKKELSRSEEKTQTSGNGLKECDMEQEEMETKNMWKLRANRVEQIFSPLNKQSKFTWSRKLGLEVNVGFGLKQNMSVDSLKSSVLLEIAKFALAINSSQQDFIMEILDYNFDLGLQSEHHRNTFACEVMDRARQLSNCEDAVKLSNDIFELPVPVSSINVVNPVCPPDSCAKSEEHISQRTVDLYPWCKEIGLKLHVNSRQPHKKLESNTFTNGAMTEVMNCAEKLCGTFEQICLDILRHNFDLDSQNGDSDLARNILAQIPAVIEQNNRASCLKSFKQKLGKDVSLLEMLDCQNDTTGSSSATMMDQSEGRAVDTEYQNELDAVSDGFSSATTMDQKMDTSGDSNQQTELDLKLWKLRANQIQQVLSIPHEEHCPLYSYWRCKNLDIDFNVGSGVKRNLDPKLLTNGIMVELSTFAIALVSARRYFITDILEYNFNLNLKNELCRTAFTQKMMDKVNQICSARVPRLNTPVELPDTRSIQEPTYNRTRFCPKCYQARNQKLHQHESDTGPLLIPSPHAMTHTVFTDGNCTAQSPSKAPSTTDETMMDSYPRCKKIGLDLCVNKHQPKDKLCNDVLNRGIMMEVISFAGKLCGTKNKLINDLLEHNFNIRKQSNGLHLAQQFYNLTSQKDGRLAWFDKVFVTHPVIPKPTRYEGKVKHASLMQGSEWKETIKKRKLALQTKGKRNRLPSHNPSVKRYRDEVVKLPFVFPPESRTQKEKSKRCSQEELSEKRNEGSGVHQVEYHSSVSCVNFLRGVVTSNEPWSHDEDTKSSRDPWRLNMQENSSQVSVGCGSPLQGNMHIKDEENDPYYGDVKPEPYTEEEFSWHYDDVKTESVAGEVRYLVPVEPQGTLENTGNQENFQESTRSEILRKSESSCHVICVPFTTTTDVSATLPTVHQADECGLYGGEDQTQIPWNDKTESDMEQEKMGRWDDYICPLEEFGLNSEGIDSGNTGNGNHLQSPTCSDLPRISEPSWLISYPPSLTSTELSSSSPAANIGMDPPLTSHPEDKKGICGGEEQTQTTKNAQNTCDMAQEEAIEQSNLLSCKKGYKKKKDDSLLETLDYQNQPNLDVCGSSSSSAPIIDQNEGSSVDNKQQNELNVKLWKLRANHIKQILSTPHEEHCPFYSYSRCKKLGIDFNLGSGEQQNRDPTLLTNGIMVELNNFATELQSARKHFVTDILEYNFNLNLKNEEYRTEFAQQAMMKITAQKLHKRPFKRSRSQFPFELPDMTCIQEPPRYCPRCYQYRQNTMTNTVSAHSNCRAQNLAKDSSFIFTTVEEKIMDNYPCCKKIGLNLFVDRDQPKDKLDTHVLTFEVMFEVANFAQKLCGTKNKIVHALIRHNFDIGKHGQDLDPRVALSSWRGVKVFDLAWLNEVFVFNPYPIRQPGHVSKVKRESDMHTSDWKETIKKRKLALQTKEGCTLPSTDGSSGKSKTNLHCTGGSYPICTVIGLDLDVTPTSRQKDKLDLKLLTKAVVTEIHTFATHQEGLYYPRTVFDILDYNFDLSSQYYRRWEFSVATASKVQSMVKQHCKRRQEEVFTLPFVFDSNASQKFGENRQNKKGISSDDLFSLPTVNSNDNSKLGSQPGHSRWISEDEAHDNEGLTHAPRNVLNKYEMEENEIETENGLWKLRSNHIEQILSGLKKHFEPFIFSKRVGLEFNVGFGPKQNMSVDTLNNSMLLEIAKFALAINSSQKDFIMEILEYNFDLNLQREHHRNIFACELMKRVRQLRSCEDAVKFSDEVFELSGPMASIKVGNHSVGSAISPSFPSDSHAESKEDVSPTSLDLYPWCKGIGLKLHVNSQPHKKLEIKKLTNGAMTEVANLTEKLCGTFEQICLDILTHNFDLDLQSGDSDLARNILARIPAVIELKNLSTYVKSVRLVKGTGKDMLTMEKLHCQNNPDLDAFSDASSSATIMDQKMDTSGDRDQETELNLKLWKLRVNQIQQILSTPHEEHCPLYSYSRCKKWGIDFNVASGVKQNLDPTLLTNGIMVELNTFATAMVSARKHFVTEILEYNFNLNLNNELSRSAFALQTHDKCVSIHKRSSAVQHRNMPFELPDMTCVQNSTEKMTYCPKCYEARQLHQDGSNPGHMHNPHPHCMTDDVSADANCISQKPAKDPSTSTFSTTEETIMDSYPCCKKIGLHLCVNKDQPKDKLDTNVLTRSIMKEVVNFSRNLCGTKYKIINDVLEHNFNIDKQGLNKGLAEIFCKDKSQNNEERTWFNEVFDFHSVSLRLPGSKDEKKRKCVRQGVGWKETIKKRQLALQAKEERYANLSRNHQSTKHCYPICTEIGLDLDVTSKSRKKEKLQLKLLTTAVVLEIHKFASKKVGDYPRTVFDILDCNFDLSSQYYRRWEFSTATASKFQTIAEQFCEEPGISSDDLFSLPSVNSNDNSKLGSQPGHSRWISEDEAHIQASTNVPHETDMEQEEMEYYYTCPLEESDIDSDEDTGLRNTCTDPTYSSQLDKKGFHDNEELTHAPRNVLNKYEMEENEIETENSLWKLRSSHTEQILSGLKKHFGPFTFSKRVGLEFNVGFGPKQNMSVDTLNNSILLEIAKFALAINSSQKDFIMEILEYNFDLDLQSEHHRNIFACELMKRVRQLRSCEDAVKFSDEVFELSGPMASIKVGNHSVGSAISPSFPSDSHAESKEDISPTSLDLYPWCKGIGLKLHVNSQPHKKLEIKKLTNGAMTEVANLTEKLCGTFEQICLDILTHNFDLDLQSGDSDLARNILARIPAVIEHKNLSTYVKSVRLKKGTGKDMLTMEKLHCQNNPDLDAFSDASSSSAIMDQKMDTSGDSDEETELNLKLWKLRVNQIQQILSTPHEEHCPLYSYSRCKKLGIDFNVASGVKQNLDPTLLTNGIMVELNTFATALVSARKHFMTEILEYNFNLNLNNELSRTAFAQQTHGKCSSIHKRSSGFQYRNMPFELPDMTCIQNSTEKMTYCPKCYEARQLHQDGSNPGHMHNPHPHCMTDGVSADANCISQKPAKDPSTSTFSTTEETIMDSYPCCKKIGLDLCVNKDQPKDKLDTNVLTRTIMMEVVNFSRNLCGTKDKIINDVLEHNFNIDKQGLNKGLAEIFCKDTSQNNEERTWFNEVFDFHSVSLRLPGSKDEIKRKCVRQGVGWKETIKKRQLALQAKEERYANLSRNHQSTKHCYPICTEIGLDLDVTSKSRKKEKLQLKLLTTAVVLEIHKFASKKVGHYPRTVFDILDCNFDLSSQYYRRWEFSTATASKFQTIAEQFCEEPGRADEVFRLPFVFDPKASERFVQKKQNNKSRKTYLHETDLEQKEMRRPENSYTCPLKESDLDEDGVRDSGNTDSDDHLPKPKSCSPSSKIPAESGTVNSKISPTIADQPENIGLCRHKEKTMPAENTPKDCELEQEDMETEMMWKLRSNRVEQILSPLNEEFGPFKKSKKVGLEFNVGFGQKQNIGVDFLSNHVLLEIAEFALAINSSQKDFILEILENNFDLGLHSQNLEHRNDFAFEVMDRVRQLRSCSDAITLSSEVFELPGVVLSVNMANQSASCISRMENAETVSRQSMGLYPWCKEIGLRLHVNNPEPHKKLEINKLTNGAMTEVMNFAEKLCGTFEQICLDILRHNFDLNWQSGDSDLARNIVEQILATMEQQNLSICVKTCKMKGTRKYISTVEKLDCQSNPTSDACGADSSQAAITDQTEGSSADSEHKNELNLKLCKLRANQIQQILSIPHEEHCPLYSYSRCKKLGIDFNVGSGVKQNLDPKLLTNGIMVELSAFSTELASATKHFVTEILEYNFNLNFKNELYRSAFAKQTMEKITTLKRTCRAGLRKWPFELPDMTSIRPLFEKRMYCPKCYQDRRNKLLQDVSDPGHMKHPCPHFRTNSPVAPDANCMVQKPAMDLSPTFSRAEEELMDSYPRCKKVGLSLCVDKDQPRDKLDTHVLTRGIILEVATFAKRLSGAKNVIFLALVEHNFNIGKAGRDGALLRMFSKAKAQNDGELAWFDKVFVIHQVSHREPGHVGKMARESAMKASERKETILKRKLALQTKEETATLPSPNTSVLKAKRGHQSTVNLYPVCTEIGLDLDVTSKAGEKEKLDLQLLTRGAVVEMHKFVTQKRGCYYPGEMFDILDYNFDLSSQHDRRWEFSIATASIVQANFKQYVRKREKLDMVFKLPFVFPPKSSNRSLEKTPKKYSKKESDKTQNDDSCVHQVQYHSDVNHVHFFGDVKTEEEHWYFEDATGTLTNHLMMNVQINQSQANIQMKEANNPHYGDVKPELDTEETYHSHFDNVKMESDTGDVLHLVPGEPAQSLGYTITTMCPNSESNINPESQNEGLHYCVLTKPQGCEGHAMLAVCPSTGSHIKTESDHAGVMYVVPVEAAVSQKYTLMDIGQGQASTSIKEEHENMPVDSYQYEVVSNTKGEVGIEQK